MLGKKGRETLIFYLDLSLSSLKIPVELRLIVRDYVHLPITDENIHDAVDEWLVDKPTCLIKFGHISYWDTHFVTNMKELFSAQLRRHYHDSSRTNASMTIFNDNINNWDTSNVIAMNLMFFHCEVFNQSLDRWNVSSVIDFSSMFESARRFNQPLNTWQVSNANTMNSMFSCCSSFNQPLNDWDVSKVNNMGTMFFETRAFNQPLDTWNVSDVHYMN